MDLSVLIPSYETRDLLLSCIASVQTANEAHPDLQVEIIVIDNGSRDGSSAAVRECYSNVRILGLRRNCGFSAAVNLGLHIRRGRHVLLLNSDVEIEESLLVHGVRILDENPRIGVVGPRLTHSDGRPQRSVHAMPGLQTEFLPDFLLRWIRPAGFSLRRASADQRDDPALRLVEAIRGAVFFFRGTLVDELGPLDERFFFFLEETEYCARTRRAGYEIVCAESLEAVHHLGASSKLRAPLATRIEFHRSLYRFLEMYRGRWVARTARGLRTLRGGVSIFVMAALCPFSDEIRRRMPERWGLFLWHLHGCPEEPRMVDALERAVAAAKDQAMATRG